MIMPAVALEAQHLAIGGQADQRVPAGLPADHQYQRVAPLQQWPVDLLAE